MTSAADSQPSYDELVAVIAAQAAGIEQLEKLAGELAARLRKDPSNSSKPPG